MTMAPPRSNRIELSWALGLDLAALVLVGTGNALMAARLNFGPAALTLVLCALLVRVAQLRTQILTLPLQLPWLLFLASAWIGVNVSFDPALSLSKFDLILGSIALYYTIATTQSESGKRLIVWGLLLVGLGAALYFVTQTDFVQNPIKLGFLNRVGVWLHDIAPQFGFHTPHANLMAGILLLALPYAAGLTYKALTQKRWSSLMLSAAVGLVIAFGLLMTTSRGALFALGLLMSVTAYLYLVAQLARRAGLAMRSGIAVGVNALLIVALLVIVLGGNRIGSGINSLLGGVGGVPRLELYQQVVQLAQDYSFTGAGLNTFSPNFSTYELLINVPFLPHAHNLLLQVWYEQGILGLLAFVWLIIAYYTWAFRRRARMNWLAVASIAATTLLLLHGLVDVLFYFSRVISLMFIPFGLTVCALDPFTPTYTVSPAISRRFRIAGAAAAGVLALVAVLFFVTRREQITAQWLANWGSLKQSQLEVPQIRFPHPTPPEVRRATDLSAAETIFGNALVHDPKNRVAHTRLGLIALDRFEFQSAVEHLETAYRADTTNRSVIKALGLAYLWTGRSDEAEMLLKQIPEAGVELGYTIGEWRERGRPDLASNAQQMLQRLKP